LNGISSIFKRLLKLRPNFIRQILTGQEIVKEESRVKKGMSGKTCNAFFPLLIGKVIKKVHGVFFRRMANA